LGGAGKPDGRDEEFYHQAEKGLNEGIKELNEGIIGEEKSETFLEWLPRSAWGRIAGLLGQLE
jgi:hypothetical protein